jgi:uncharacterized membrane protein
MAAHADPRPIVTTAALYLISAVAYARLPPGTFGPAFIAFLLPTAAAAIYVLMRLLAVHDHVRRGNGTFARTYDAIVFRLVLFIGALHGAVLIGLIGRGLVDRTGPLVPRLAPVLLGTALMAVGNLLPRLRPNVALGIRTSRTLRNRDAWLRANRRAGYVAVALGFAIVAVAALIPPGPPVIAIIGGMGFLAVVMLVAWTWRDTYRSQITGLLRGLRRGDD